MTRAYLPTLPKLCPGPSKAKGPTKAWNEKDWIKSSRNQFAFFKAFEARIANLFSSQRLSIQDGNNFNAPASRRRTACIGYAIPMLSLKARNSQTFHVLSWSSVLLLL